MFDLFETRSIQDFSKSVRDVFNLMTITRKYKVIGSASYKHAKYVSDYDLSELFDTGDHNNILHKIYLLFRGKFEEAENDPNLFITDFKCGMDSDGEPLRWNKHDMKKGFKILKSGDKIAFQDCVLMKTTLKLDVIAVIDSIFTEFSDNYYIKIGHAANFFESDISKEKIMNELKHSFDEYFYVAKNYMKGLKRCFSYYDIAGGNLKKMESLFNFFNSSAGMLYKQRSEILTILTVLDQNFRTPKIADIRKNIELIAEKCKFLRDRTLEKSLVAAYRSNDFKIIQKNLDDASNELLKAINLLCTQFLKNNKSVLLY